ncbi:14253_t:CDS:2, partial [Gigaspora rosea]
KVFHTLSDLELSGLVTRTRSSSLWLGAGWWFIACTLQISRQYDIDS